MKNNVSSRRRSKASRGRNRRFLVLVAALAVIAIALTAFGVRHAIGKPRAVAVVDATPTVTVPTPARAKALPAPAWSNAERAQLQAALRDAFSQSLSGADAWSLAVLAPDGRVLYDDRASHAVTAASTQKLIVAATALSTLGGTFRYHTLLTANAPVGDGGRLAGDLMLAGSGDPSFKSDDLRGGVTQLVRGGLHSIDGGVVVDPHAIAGPEINPLWNADDANEDFEAPTSGISLDQDTVEFHVIGNSPGTPARVTFVPASNKVHFDGSVTSSGNGGDDVTIAAMETPNQFTVSGAIPSGTEEKFWVPIHNLPAYAADVLSHMLRSSGVAVAGPSRTGVAPAASVTLWDHRSRPLRGLIGQMLYESNNHFAEQILRTVGGVDGNGDDASGLGAERRFLALHGIPEPGLHIVDGSGLAHANRIAAITLASILLDAQKRGGDEALYFLLPQGGRQGTLRHYNFTDALGRVRAKSGHLFGVSALAGYVNTLHHGRVVFAFAIDDSPGDPDSAIVRAVDRLSTM